VYYPKQDRYRPLVDVSPVVRTLAETQFDDYVKRVRIFVHPELRLSLQSLPNSAAHLQQVLDAAWTDIAPK
jgi:hypothetical protein